MLKTNSLRKGMIHGCRWCQANPEKFTIFVESGNIETTGETPSFEYAPGASTRTAQSASPCS
ncbi:phage tail protein [Escherichia coli]|nr:phage tail protein [Escherichia coli]